MGPKAWEPAPLKAGEDGSLSSESIQLSSAFFFSIQALSGLDDTLVVKKLLANVRDIRTQVQSRVGKIPWRRTWQPTPVFLPGESHGQRSLVGYSPQGHQESEMTEVTWHTGNHTGRGHLLYSAHQFKCQSLLETPSQTHPGLTCN